MSKLAVLNLFFNKYYYSMLFEYIVTSGFLEQPSLIYTLFTFFVTEILRLSKPSDDPHSYGKIMIMVAGNSHPHPHPHTLDVCAIARSIT
jgi:hypothetical protein